MLSRFLNSIISIITRNYEVGGTCIEGHHFNQDPLVLKWYSPASARGIPPAVTPSFLVLAQVGASAAGVTQLVAMPAFVSPSTTLLFFSFIFVFKGQLCISSLDPTPATDLRGMTLWTLPSSMPYLSTHPTSVHAICFTARHFFHEPQFRTEMSSVPLLATVLARVLHTCMHISFPFPLLT